MKSFLKRNYSLLIVCLGTGILLLFYPTIGQQTVASTFATLKNFILTIPPIFVCIGLLDVWIDKEHMLKAMGDTSGVKGILIAFLFGTITAVPLYALLPIAGLLLKKECRLLNVLIFICSCASIRIPLLLFEVSSLGWKFTTIRLACNIVIVLFIALFIEKIITMDERKRIYCNAKQF